jgi:hypothetical protein
MRRIYQCQRDEFDWMQVKFNKDKGEVEIKAEAGKKGFILSLEDAHDLYEFLELILT